MLDYNRMLYIRPGKHLFKNDLALCIPRLADRLSKYFVYPFIFQVFFVLTYCCDRLDLNIILRHYIYRLILFSTNKNIIECY